MPCLLALFGTFFPRLAVLIVWLVRPTYMSNAFGGAFIWPLLGIVFLPFTTLIYVLLYRPGIGVVGWDYVWIAIALFFDLSNWFGTYSQRRYGTRYVGSAG